jgi:hypothetical protein
MVIEPRIVVGAVPNGKDNSAPDLKAACQAKVSCV